MTALGMQHSKIMEVAKEGLEGLVDQIFPTFLKIFLEILVEAEEITEGTQITEVQI
jgi:hypothetical protein